MHKVFWFHWNDQYKLCAQSILVPLEWSVQTVCTKYFTRIISRVSIPDVNAGFSFLCICCAFTYITLPFLILYLRIMYCFIFIFHNNTNFRILNTPTASDFGATPVMLPYLTFFPLFCRTTSRCATSVPVNYKTVCRSSTTGFITCKATCFDLNYRSSSGLLTIKFTNAGHSFQVFTVHF